MQTTKNKRSFVETKTYKMKPIEIEVGEWYYKGCFIQRQYSPNLRKYHVFKDTEDQETIDTCQTFKHAVSLCNGNEVKSPFFGLKSFV